MILRPAIFSNIQTVWWLRHIWIHTCPITTVILHGHHGTSLPTTWLFVEQFFFQVVKNENIKAPHDWCFVTSQRVSHAVTCRFPLQRTSDVGLGSISISLHHHHWYHGSAYKLIRWAAVGVTKYSRGCLNIKMFYQYGDSHVKDKIVSPTILSLTWESPYLGKTVFILRLGPCYHRVNLLITQGS